MPLRLVVLNEVERANLGNQLLDTRTVEVRGRIERAKEGLYHGGAFFPIGYNYVDGRLAVNEYEALQVRKIYEWYLDGTSPEKPTSRYFD